MVSPQTSPSKKDGSPTFHKGIKRVARHVLDSDRVLQLMEMNGILEPEKAYVLEAANLHLEDIYDLSDVPRLRTLDVTNNRLTNLRNLVGVRHLRELRAGTNRIDDADDVGVCKELEALYLQDNLLEEAPRTLGGLRSLKTLRLDRWGTKWANADCLKCNMDNPFEVENLVANCCVVGNIAGPFMLTGGERLVEACIHYDTDYCDVSGEIPWSAKILQFHDLARDAGVYIVPSAAYAGGLPDIMAYMMAQKMREVDGGAEIKKLHGYVSMYQENEGTVGSSGGTLSTRAAMSTGDKWVRSVMMNPFALGGKVQDGSREEDQDKVLTKVFRDPVVKSWVAPHVYAFFETRVVRRSNMLHNMLVGGPDMGFWYGPELNFTVYALMPDESTAKQFKKGSTSTKAEEERLRAEGKYYGAGEGPPLDELFEIGVYSLYHMVAISDSGKKLCWSIKGRDGYFETARMCVETALTMACSAPELRSGPCSVRGGMLGAGLAGKDILFDRLRKSGMGFIDWSPGTANDGNLNCNVLEAAVVGKLGAAPVIRWVTKTPFPLSNRVAFAAVYPELDDAADLRFYMSSDGTEAIAKAQFYDVGEDATFALVNIKMSGWSVKPLDGGGCRVRYAYSADLGGNVPRFVANKKAPGIVDAALPGVEAWIKKRRA